MAQVLKLTDLDTEIDLLNGDFKLLDEGFTLETGRGYIWQNIDLGSTATDVTVRTTQIRIDQLIEKARSWNPDTDDYDPVESDPVWLYYQSEGENPKRALVVDGETEIPGSQSKMGPLLGEDAVALRIVLKRKAEAENVIPANPSKATVSSLGGTWEIGSPSGSKDQRIAKLQVDTQTAAFSHQQIWFGIRPYYKGISSFNPLWEAEDGSLASNGGTIDADASASGGSRVTTDLSQTANGGLRGQITIGQIAGSNYDHFVGKYLVLGRMKLSDGTTQVAVEMRSYWQGSHSSAGLVYIDGTTAWTLIPLGVVMFPPTGNRNSIGSSSTAFQNLGFSIYATRVSGAGNLYMDCFVLIPAEHIVTIRGSRVTVDPITLYLYTDLDDHQWALGESTLSQGGLQPSFESWDYPYGGGLLVAASQADTGHNLTATLDLDMEIYPRWKTFRQDAVT